MAALQLAVDGAERWWSASNAVVSRWLWGSFSGAGECGCGLKSESTEAGVGAAALSHLTSEPVA